MSAAVPSAVMLELWCLRARFKAAVLELTYRRVEPGHAGELPSVADFLTFSNGAVGKGR
jgi:hypothetical protein